MPLNVFQRSVVDEAGNVMPAASVEVRDQDTAALVQLYSDYDGASPIGNPTAADANGFVRLYVAAGRYRIEATSGALSRVWEDEVLGVVGSLIEYERTAAEISAGLTISNYQYRTGWLYRYGTNTTPGTTDMTTALNNCYAACKAAIRVPMIIPAQIQRFTSNLDWDGSVDVFGESFEFSELRKDGNFDGITIDGLLAGAAQVRFENFNVNSTSGSDTTGKGIVISGSHNALHRISSTGHGSHGFYLTGGSDTGFMCSYTNLIASTNGGDGMLIDSNQYASYMENLDLRANTGWGFNLLAPAAYHNGKNIICQQNVAGGAQIAGIQNTLEIYAESNTGIDIQLTAASNANNISVLHVDTQADFSDLGTDNMGMSISASGAAFMSPNFGRPKRMTNVAGATMVIAAGAAGAGASPMAGGALTISGGDADGTGDAAGGRVYVRGGTAIGTDRDGELILQETDGLIVARGASSETTKAYFQVHSGVTDQGFLGIPRLTTTQKNAITSVPAGLMVYDTTLSKLCVYTGAAWQTITSA